MSISSSGMLNISVFLIMVLTSFAPMMTVMEAEEGEAQAPEEEGGGQHIEDKPIY